MSTEFEINVGEEKEPSPAEEMSKDLEEKKKLEVLYSTLKKLMTGQSGLSGSELEMMKEQTIKQIAECLEEY